MFKYFFRTCNVLPFSCTHLAKHQVKWLQLNGKTLQVLKKHQAKWVQLNHKTLQVLKKSLLLGNEDTSINGSSDIFIMSSIVQVAFVIGAYSYILVKTKIIQDRITSPVNQEVYIKQQISNVARKTDNICLGISMGLNFVTVICYVTFCSI